MRKNKSFRLVFSWREMPRNYQKSWQKMKQIEIELDEKQTEAFEKGKKTKAFLLWWKVGEGKTRITLALAQHFLRLASSPYVVLAILRRKAFWDLRNEVHKIGLDWHVFEFEDVATLKQSERQAIFTEQKPQIWMISADSLHKFTKEFFTYVKYIIIDELWLFGNPKSKRSRVATSLIQKIRRPRVGASGSIQPNSDNTSVWGQCCVVGIENNVARNLTNFRSLYQISSVSEMGQRSFMQRRNRPGSVKKIIERIESNTHVWFPKNSSQVRIKDTILPITKEQKAEIKKLKKEWLYEIKEGKVIEIRYALEMLHKVRQISSGYIKDGEGNIRSIPSNKQLAAKQMVEELVAAHEQIIIWCAFKYDVRMLCELFKGQALPFTGEAPFDVAKFQSGKYPVVVGTSASGSSTNIFKDIAYAIYYSPDYSATVLQQSMGRTDRKDSRHNARRGGEDERKKLWKSNNENSVECRNSSNGCFYEFLLVEGTADLDILTNARQDNANEQTMINIFTKWLQA